MERSTTPLTSKSVKARWPHKRCRPSSIFISISVDLRGGWCDASGDVSKYFSHLAYANFMSPQQTPLVVWSMADVVDTAPALLESLKAKTPLMDEAVYGADYLMHSLSPDGYVYRT